VPDVFIPRLLDLYTSGRFPFGRLSKFYPLDAVNDAIADSESGKTLKPILRQCDGGAAN
jgi:aryl-alcohol dehydrogenase